MICISAFEAFQIACKAKDMWGIYLMFPEGGDILKAAPWLKRGPSGNATDGFVLALEGSGIVLFDIEEEMLRCYNATVGDAGPTETNPYDGPCRVHAITCSPKGQLLNENT